MKKYIFISAIASIIVFAFFSCSSSRKTTTSTPSVYTLNLALVSNIPADKYVNLEYGIRVNVQDGRADKRIIQIYDASATYLPHVQTNPSIGAFIPESTRRYMRTMGFNLDADVATDYMMQIVVKEFHVDYLSGIGWNGTVVMDLKVFDHNRATVYPTVEVSGRSTISGSASSLNAANFAINKAYANALDDIDWDRIAFFLKRADNPQNEANKNVSGEGNTALEHLIVHWNVESRPRGGDVYWRVVSQTDKVKNQNYKWLATTPFEGTKALNIPGLTYNNSGDVQIEIKVEKEGYYPQVRQYNLRSIIDEKEVSAMIPLVKEDE